MSNDQTDERVREILARVKPSGRYVGGTSGHLYSIVS